MQLNTVWRRSLAIAGFVLVMSIGAVVGVTRVFPSIGAQGADALRNLLGDQTVARIETVFFKIDDTVKHWEYGLGVGKTEAPWAAPTSTNQNAPVAEMLQPSIPPPKAQKTPIPVTSEQKVPSAAPATAAWPPANLTPLGKLPGEGVWEAYIQDPSGQVVAYRTFVQPDPSRPYALVAVVALNLNQTRLHFALGSEEPYATTVSERASGLIPARDLVPGALLATFNGGFKVAQGHFGAMADGLTSVPPRDGLATLALYGNGGVRMGAWGSDIQPAADMVAFRQNGALIVQAGKPTPQLDDPHLWGFTVGGNTVTWRSAIGLDATSSILYYFAGPYINIGTLATAILATRVQTAMQLDINNYWVLFDAIHGANGSLTAEPLLKDMSQDPARYLHRSQRDFFYLTGK